MTRKSYFGREEIRIARQGSLGELEQLFRDLEASGDIEPDETLISSQEYSPEDLLQIDGPDSGDYDLRADPDGEENYRFWN